MKRPALHNRLEEEVSDTFSTSAPNSSNTNHEDASPYLTNNYNGSDSESLSDSFGKNRKKRNTYQKIPDDVRVGLLDAVKNGETLKSAAKRYKINYSSAKSILHTYRKEGRIRKKSAQERTSIKKKNSISLSSVSSECHVPNKMVKRESNKGARSYSTVSQSLSTIPEEFKPEINHSQNGAEINAQSLLKNVAFGMNTADSQHNNVYPMNFQEENHHHEGRREDDYSQNQPRLFENYNNNYGNMNFMEVKMDMFRDMPQYHAQNYSIFSNDNTNSFDDLDTRWHTKTTIPEEYTADPNGFLSLKGVDERIGRFENEMVFNNYNDANWNYMDVLRRSQNNMYNEGQMEVRKSSIDFF
jgi:hypothetical protein